MKFLSLALLAGAAVAQVSVIQDAITNIGSKTEALDSAINAYNGGSTDSLISAANAVISAINTGNTNVMGISAVDSTDAFTLVGPIQTLAGQVNTAVNDLISKKSALSSQSGLVHQNVQQILDATNTFSNTVYSKIPDSLVSTAQGLVAPIISDLNRALNAFPNTPSGGSSSSSSGPTSTSSGSGSTSTGSTAPMSSAPVYSVSSATVVVPTTMATSGTGSIVVPPTSISPPITSASSTPAPYNPNGASQLTGGFAAVVVAAAVAVAAF